MKRILFVFSLVLMTVTGRTQVFDDFSDGEISSNPTWQGDITRWQVNAQLELQSNGSSASDLIHLSTPSTRLNDTEWRFRMRYTAGGPSGSNQARFYLTSDQSDLEGALNGYFVGVGETGSDDSYDLFRQDGNTRTKIIDGANGLAGAGIDAVVRVLRDDQGNWDLAIDTGDGIFQNQGSVLDLTHQSTSFSGPWVSHTSTRAQSFFFDDIYIGNEILDLAPPELLTIDFESSQRLRLRFSENLEVTSAQLPGNYAIDKGIGNPQLAQLLSPQLQEVRLEFASPLQNNQTYELTLSGIADLAGNVLSSQAFPFTFLLPEIAQPGDIILNEFMADPSPSQGLPAEEFVELYNRSNKLVDLDGWTISDGNSTGTLPNQLLQAGEYVMLVSEANAPLFSVLGPLISPSSLPGLNNTGDFLILKNPEGITIDSIRYNLDWYGDPGKAQGGFSLELINPENRDCPSAANWTASASGQGGTPGQENSVFSLEPETEPPFLASISVIEPDEILLCFNEVMDPASLTDLTQYSLNPGGRNPVELIVGEEARCVNLKFSNSLARGDLFSLEVNGPSDCAGNSLPSNSAIAVGRGIIPQSFEVVITEFMPDPTPSQGLPEAEFVEIYNRLDQVVELNNFKLSDGGSIAQWESLVLLPREHLIICQDEFAEEFRSLGRVLSLPFLPSQNNSGDTLRLLTPFDGLMDEVIYERSWYQDEIKDDGGFSLERIDPDFVNCNNSHNWRASQSSQGGTPGQLNSINGLFEDATAPQIQSLSVTENGLLINFSEPMDLVELGNTENYEVDQEIGIPLLALVSSELGNQVELTFAQALDTNRIYLLTLSDLTDCSGNPLASEGEIHIPIGIPVPAMPGDLLINEILFNPYTGGADFVEIANAGENILDLQDLLLGESLPASDTFFNADPVSESSILLLPGELVCLTRDVAFQQRVYQTPPEARFLEMSGFPSYDDAEGVVALVSSDSVLFDRFEYLDDFHYPTLIDDDGVSLERLSLFVASQEPSNWHSASSLVGYATPGYTNSQAQALTQTDEEVFLGLQVFSPNLDGVDDLLPIHYQFDFVGANARVYIYDTRGNLVKRLQENLLLDPAPGVFFWDGFNERNQKAAVGMYVVVFDVLNDDTGQRQVYRKVAVLADVFE